MSESTDLPQASSTTSEADADHTADAAPDEPSLAGISDDQLPEDLKPGDDNPLAQPLDPDAPETRSREELGVLDESDSEEESSDGPPMAESQGPDGS